MDLLSNPFQILGASLRDDRQRILELADDMSLVNDADICMEARAELTNPRKRLKAELAWICGVRPSRASELISILGTSPQNILEVDNIHCLAKANFIASALSSYRPESIEDIVKWVLELANQFDQISCEQLQTMLNEERIVSGFPEINDLSSIEAELQERRNYYRTTIKAALDQFSQPELVKAVTDIVDIATDCGQVHGPVLVEDVVDTYEIEAQDFLETEGQNISTLVSLIEEKLDSQVSEQELSGLLDKLINVVRNWDNVAQPIQVLTMSLGREHEASARIANDIRSLAIYMFNEYGMLELSRKLTEMLQEVFAEVVRIAEKSAEDAEALQEIADQREQYLEQAKKQEEEWRREVTYEADVGAIFKDKLKISPDGIEWKGRKWPLEKITRVRWGATKHSVNGIPTGTTYKIFWGTDADGYSLELKKGATFTNFIDRLWKTVGVRLLTEFLEDLGNGKQFKFGSATICDEGVELIRRKFFGSDEKIFCTWNELVIWNGGGSFCIGKKGDKKLTEGFSYQDQNNIHILEAAIRAFWKRGGHKLSSLLEQ